MNGEIAEALRAGAALLREHAGDGWDIRWQHAQQLENLANGEQRFRVGQWVKHGDIEGAIPGEVVVASDTHTHVAWNRESPAELPNWNTANLVACDPPE